MSEETKTKKCSECTDKKCYECEKIIYKPKRLAKDVDLDLYD